MIDPKEKEGLVTTLDRISSEAEAAADQGIQLIVLSDRAVSQDRIPVSALLAVGAVHHHLVKQTKRTRIGLLVETGEAREVHHHCLLIGYGADGISPYLAFESLWQASRDGLMDEGMNDEKIVAAYRKGVAKGMLKVMAKMGISTLQSYKEGVHRFLKHLVCVMRLLISVLWEPQAEFKGYRSISLPKRHCDAID